MDFLKASLCFCAIILCANICLSQTDCSGFDCPVIPNCIDTVLENDACCPKCTQKGCTCEGYQYYDCVKAGYQNGKVPEGKSYFVDFGSTECSCPRGGGKISCQFIPCPEIPPNCIEVLQPADGCPQCGRVGCTHGNKKYEGGHSFQIDRCQVCHCPNKGGKLMCSLIPGCDLRSANGDVPVTSTENNTPLRDMNGGHDTQQRSQGEAYSELGLGNTLPLYKEEPPSFSSNNYDYRLADPTPSNNENIAPPLDSAAVAPNSPKSNSTTHITYDDTGHEFEKSQTQPNSKRSVENEIKQNAQSTTVETKRKTLVSPTAATMQKAETTQEELLHQEGERAMRLDHDREEVGQEALKVSSSPTHSSPGYQRPTHYKRENGSTGSNLRSNFASNSRQEITSLVERHSERAEEQDSNSNNRFSPTHRAPFKIRNDDFLPWKKAVVQQVRYEDLVNTCCEKGEQWASAVGHCDDMKAHEEGDFFCWTAQYQCCISSLRERQCLAGIRGAKAGDNCEAHVIPKCEIDSYKDCCRCCSLGLLFQKEAHQCKAHQFLGFDCQRIFMTCCEGKVERDTITENTAPDFLPGLRQVSDNLYPKEAFSIGEERDGGNAVDGPVEVEDMDECLIYEGNICHHRCVNTLGSFRCECFPGYVLLDDAYTCAEEVADEENKLREADREALETTPPLPPPTKPTVPPNPCEGNNICEQQCTPVDGKAHCSCSLGFSLRADGHSCEDINECLSVRACQLNERCINSAGSYVCQRVITCPPGYKLNNDICEDINECEQNHNCGDGFECVNTVGSFRCNPKPRCPVGFNQNSQGTCVDIDECGASTQPCGPGFNCVNTPGSYVCNRKLVCSRGYHASPDGSRCVDVNECENKQLHCGEGQLCLNLPGSYRCECQTGYQYDSYRRMCVDVNECWRYPGRLCAQTCENTPGSYECSCTSGFRLSGDGKNCEDVNECLANPCSQECTNIYGSYQCYCRQGYYLREDGHSCEDIDECSQSLGLLCTYKCVNVPGSYQCACPEYGYTMLPNGRSCKDIDECATGVHNCSLAEMCYNIQGGYRCLSLSCPINYHKVSDTRCDRTSCPNNVECQNSPVRITYYYLSFQSNIIIPAQIFRIGPSPAYSGDNVIVTITEGNEETYFSTRKLNAYTGAVYLQRQVQGPRDFLITVEMKLWRQGTFTTFQAKIYVFITANQL